MSGSWTRRLSLRRYRRLTLFKEWHPNFIGPLRRCGGTRQVIELPAWHGHFPVFNLPFAEKAPEMDSNLAKLTGHDNIQTVKIPDKVLTSWDTMTRKSLAALSHADWYLATLSEMFPDAKSQRDTETVSNATFVGRDACQSHAGEFLSVGVLHAVQETDLPG